MAKVTLYQILGVKENASDADLKSAYRKRAKECHPDVSHALDAAEKFKQLNAAYEILSNPRQRSTYDASLVRQRCVSRDSLFSGAVGITRTRTWTPNGVHEGITRWD